MGNFLLYDIVSCGNLARVSELLDVSGFAGGNENFAVESPKFKAKLHTYIEVYNKYKKL